MYATRLMTITMARHRCAPLLRPLWNSAKRSILDHSSYTCISCNSEQHLCQPLQLMPKYCYTQHREWQKKCMLSNAVQICGTQHKQWHLLLIVPAICYFPCPFTDPFAAATASSRGGRGAEIKVCDMFLNSISCFSEV